MDLLRSSIALLNWPWIDGQLKLRPVVRRKPTVVIGNAPVIVCLGIIGIQGDGPGKFINGQRFLPTDRIMIFPHTF